MHLLTVSHSKEIAALRLQARSIARHVSREAVQSINIVVNQPSAEEFLAAFQRDVLPEYGPHRERVRVIPRDALFPMPAWIHGWRSQQLLKLMATRILPDEGVMLVLDTKNHFIREITEASYRLPDGRLRTWKAAHRGHMERHFVPSVTAFDLDPADVIDAWLPTVTPFPVSIADTRECFEALMKNTDDGFAGSFILSTCLMTEFFLITAYQKRKYGDLAIPYAFGPLHSAILFRDKVIDANRFGSMMYLAHRPTTLSFAVHHGAFADLTADQRGRIADLWLASGLIASLEEADAFLVSPYGNS